MDRIDYKQVFKECYSAAKPGIPVLLDVPPMQFLMLDGSGGPVGSEGLQPSAEALFRLAYAVKSLVKKGPMALDFTVMPLECLWRGSETTALPNDRCCEPWTLMIMQAPVVDAALVESARRDLLTNEAAPLLEKVRLARFDEGTAVQTLHVGPLAEAGPSIERLQCFAQEEGYRPTAKYHEIYLSEPQRTASAKRRTLLRQPVTREASA